MATGKIKDLYPPGNNGSRNGAGQITLDGTSDNYVFQTPDDIDQASVPISAGTPVTFDIGNGKQAGNVKQVAPPTCTLTANPTRIVVGSSTILTWASVNAVTLTIDNGVGNVTPLAGGQIEVAPPTSIVYTLTATNSSGQSASASVSIAVASEPPDR